MSHDRDNLDYLFNPSSGKTTDIYGSTKQPQATDKNELPIGYGSQVNKQHPFYRTTSKEYGWYVPGEHTVSSVYYPTKQNFSSYLAAAGMYRNHSLNTGMDPAPYK